MKKFKILSGEEIVAKGATKIEVSLPELGLKDVTPNGSWLEQKQTQSALEARKHLVEVPRIDKSGILNHAEWRENLKLAEVIQQTGGFWQFMGHHRDRKLYLKPEEALYLMETNLLLLRYNEVKVSLQQAYSMLLSNEFPISHYKVYGSLSRLGYKVFRHDKQPVSNEESNIISENSASEELESVTPDKMETESSQNSDKCNEQKNEAQTIVDCKINRENVQSIDTMEVEEQSVTIENKQLDDLAKKGNNENESENKPFPPDEMGVANQNITSENRQVSAMNKKTSSDVLPKNMENNETSDKPDSVVAIAAIKQNATIKINQAKEMDTESSTEILGTNMDKNRHESGIDAMEVVDQNKRKQGNDISNKQPSESIAKNMDNNATAVDAMEIVEQDETIENKQATEMDKQSPTELLVKNKDKENCSNLNTSSEPEVIITSENHLVTTDNSPNGLNVQGSITIPTKNAITPDDIVCDNNNSSKAAVCTPGPSNILNVDPLISYCQQKLQKLKSRQFKASPSLDVHKSFANCPDLLQNQIVTIHKPKEEYTPENICLNNLHYVINIENVRTKNMAQANSNDSTYSLTDEVNGAHIRRVTSSLYERPQTQPASVSFPSFFQSFRQNLPFRHHHFWRPRPNLNYFQFNMFFQRPFTTNFNPRFQFIPRMQIPIFPRTTVTNVQTDSTINNDCRGTPNTNRKRRKDHARDVHLNNLQNLAVRLKQLNHTGAMKAQNIRAIQSLIDTYNVRFRTKLRLSDQYEIVSDETIVDTITLDDDDEEESSVKKPKLDDKTDFFLENLNKIRQAALKLKSLELQNKSSARHRRALSNVIKTFNKSFNADIYMTDKYNILDRRHINLDSSSESDCVIEERPKVKSGKKSSGKKLRNPFNILKRLSEKHVSINTSRPEASESPVMLSSPEFHTELEKTFNKTWLPQNNDFGRPEIIPRDTMTARIIETKKEELLFDFLKNEPCKFRNWVDIKIAFLESIEETNAILHTEAMIENNIDIKSLVQPEDCVDMSTVLKKLSIIQSKKNTMNESVLEITFDVYNRDVKDFRKGSRPTPHFRVVCIDESSPCPAGVDIATLHSSIKDDVTMLFAVVGVSSISYLQMNPVDLPVYVPSSDLG